jgi:hypothetical protein
MNPSEQDRTLQRDHWQAIASQLGLAPEPEAAPVESLVNVPEPANYLTPKAVPPALVEQNAEIESEPKAAASLPPEPQPPVAAQDDTQDKADADAAPEEPPELPKRLKQGRKRRSSKATRPSEGPATEAPYSEAAAESGGEEKAARSDRSRGRRKATKSAKDEFKEVSASKPPPVDAADAGEDEDELSSTWSVPSWNDLIASLYRPER